MNTVAMMIHVHPALDAPARADLERKLMGHAGVDCAEFREEAHRHSLLVTYDPDAVERMEILDEVRTVDPEATTVGC